MDEYIRKGIITLIILLILVIFLFICLEQVKSSIDPSEEECKSVNGTYNDKDYIGTICYGVDKEGYKFIWNFEDSIPYKRRL